MYVLNDENLDNTSKADQFRFAWNNICLSVSSSFSQCRAKCCVAVFLLVLCAAGVAAADEIVISVSGNKRTRTIYIENIVNDYLARNRITRAADVNTVELKELIVDKELFSAVDVDVNGDRIDIRVKDRWTLIPIPIVTAQSGQDTKYGFFAMESNLLGYGKVGVIGGMYSQSQSSFFLMYQDPEVGFSDWMFGAQVSQQPGD